MTTSLLHARLGVDLPVVAAPMAGGPSNPALVIAAARAGSMGFLAAGYKSADALSIEIAEVRAAGGPFGVNLFAPNPVPVDRAAYDVYAAAISELAGTHGVDASAIPVREDDDDWEAKVAALLARPVPVVSFTFGIPEPEVFDAFRAVGTLTVQTVTDAEEARAAQAAGADGLVVQSAFAGGHWGTVNPGADVFERDAADLVAEIRQRVELPLWGAGGVAAAEDVDRILTAGAEAVVVGTILLRSEEAGTSATYRAALADPARTGTAITRAFSGRPARGLRNVFLDRFGPVAPLGYPAIHHLTSPLRRAATAAGDAEAINLWAGTGFRSATAEPVGVILRRLTGR